jgi:uncharacterized protein
MIDVHEDERTRAAVEDASRLLVDAVNASDVERVISLWSDDGTLLPPHHPRVVGRESIRGYFAELFSICRLRFQLTSSRIWTANDTACQQVDYIAEITLVGGGPIRRDCGKGLHLFCRQPTGRWLLALDIWNSDIAADALNASSRRRLKVLPGAFAINRGAPDVEMPRLGETGSFLTISRTAEELSVVAAESIAFDGFVKESGWRCLKVLGPLAFDEVGVLADLSTTLAKAGVSIVAISTYDTDYLLIKDSALTRAVDALAAAGHEVTR